jgi:2-dehydro-3-deoxygalactonokinase
VVGAKHEVVREVREPAGIKSLHEEAVRGKANSEADRAAVFADFLRARLEKLMANEKCPSHPLPLVISGMASSSVGWRELPYAQTPFALDGSGLRSQELNWRGPDWLGTTHLISGVATEFEMMRGEESEIIGLMSDPSVAAVRKCCLLILPGTHSKHVWIENDSVVDFRTFMTGELFEVLGRQSLLRASVDLSARAESNSFSELDEAAFREGVLWASERGLAAGLFRVRTRAVLGGHSLAENTWFFSGLLIGAELADVGKNGRNRPVMLAATCGLSEYYGLALKMVTGAATERIELPPERVERAVISAHALFLRDRTTDATVE